MINIVSTISNIVPDSIYRPPCIKGKQCLKLLDGTKMEKISIEQQGKILGGYDAEGCKKLQRWANEYAEMMEPEDWDIFADAFYDLCV